jgi:hypothetical protein
MVLMVFCFVKCDTLLSFSFVPNLFLVNMHTLLLCRLASVFYFLSVVSINPQPHFSWCFFRSAVSVGEHVDEVIGAAVADGKVTPRVQSLIKILLKYQHTDDFRAIIFVERVVTALVLPKVKTLLWFIHIHRYFLNVF